VLFFYYTVDAKHELNDILMLHEREEYKQDKETLPYNTALKMNLTITFQTY
jgi:hypothetical protein